MIWPFKKKTTSNIFKNVRYSPLTNNNYNSDEFLEEIFDMTQLGEIIFEKNVYMDTVGVGFPPPYYGAFIGDLYRLRLYENMLVISISPNDWSIFQARPYPANWQQVRYIESDDENNIVKILNELVVSKEREIVEIELSSADPNIIPKEVSQFTIIED